MEAEIDEETLAIAAITEFIRANDWSSYLPKRKRTSDEKADLWATPWGLLITH